MSRRPTGLDLGQATLVHTSTAETSRDAEELASLRPARRNAPSARTKPVPSEVTGGIACFCGERFGATPDDALRFMLHLRSEVGRDLALIERRRQRDRRRYWNWRAENPPKPRFADLDTLSPEYRRRVKSGLARGLTREQARGAIRVPPRERGRCGTEAGYSTHRRHGESACADCKKAHALAVSARRLRKMKPLTDEGDHAG